MPEPFKNLFNEKVIRGMAAHLKNSWPEFNEKGFIQFSMHNLEGLELKQRSEQIKQALIQYLPDDYPSAAAIMLASLGTELQDDLSQGIDEHGIAGWGIMPMVDYVGQQGLGYFEISMNLFKEMTKRSSSEFGIRYFLIAEQKKTLATLKKWATDENHHVRRLASEGSRPRLPWAMRLPDFINNPEPVITLLELLKNDEKEYVRRSVANSLNDIAKDHPDRVAEIAEQWMINADKEREKLVRHACRTLLKKGHKKALSALGYQSPKIKNSCIEIHTAKVEFGGFLQFSLSLDSSSKELQAVMIDYIIHHQKANGTTSPKVFKWKTTTLATNKPLNAIKNHPMKMITTRSYYPGKHTLEVVVNGISIGTTDFQLTM